MKYSNVHALVITGFGLNCERETSAAFSQCGASVSQVHLNDLLEGQRGLDEFQILAFIGGFSFGDHLGAGTVFANRVKYRLRAQLEKFVADGKLIIGICNGFQTLTRLGIVPACGKQYFTQQAALAHNDSGLFRDDWILVEVNIHSPCVFTKGIELMRLPIRHGEGKFVASNEIITDMKAHQQIVLKYISPDGSPTSEFPYNPNGSLEAIAGICDPTGRIFGLMPHPEAFLSPYNAPDWHRQQINRKLPKEGEGLAIFRNAVEFAGKNLR